MQIYLHNYPSSTRCYMSEIIIFDRCRKYEKAKYLSIQIRQSIITMINKVLKFMS